MDKQVILTEDVFGELTDDGTPTQSVKRFTWKTARGMTVQVVSYGATITSIKVPDRSKNIADVVMGFDNMDGYRQKANPYFGATVGRVANRTAGGRFVLNGCRYELSKNIVGNHLHGGIKGFDKVNWDTFVSGTKVVFSYLSRDGEEGYPGNLLTEVVYEVTYDNSIKIHMTAKSTQPTPINLTNHSYFNLSGHGTGASEMLEHVITINTDSYTELDKDLIVTGKIKKLEEMNLAHDISKPTKLKDVMPIDGFDINFCLKKANTSLNFIAKVSDPKSGRFLEMYGSQPGVQFYTSNFLPSASDNKLIGKDGACYYKHGAFCLEPQNYPNAVNQPTFPNSILNPGEEYVHDMIFKFGTE